MLRLRLPFSGAIVIALSPALVQAAPNGTPSTELSSSAEAESPHEDQGTERERTAKGSHFFLEAGVGFGFRETNGPVFSGMLGAGGRVPGSPLRLYLATELARTSGDVSAASSEGAYPLEVASTDMSLGFRGYVPVYARLRFFADALIGRSLTEVSPVSSGPPQVDFRRSGAANDWSTVFTLAAGVQLRVIDELSCGARGRVTLGGDDRLGAGLQGERWSVGGVLAAHF
jgi:hypothetical protein